MALQTSGPISLSQIAGQFGDSAPHSLSEQYGATTNIPASGAISLSQFYGAPTTQHTISPLAGPFCGTWRAPRANTSGTVYTASFSISPGITVSSSVQFYTENGTYLGGQKRSYVTINPGQSNSVSSSIGVSYPVLSFSGTMTSFTFYYETTDSEGDMFDFAVSQIDGGNRAVSCTNYYNISVT